MKSERTLSRGAQLGALLLATSFGCSDAPSAPSGPRLHELRLVSAPVEHAEVAGLGPTELSHRELLDKLATIASDADVRGLLLRIGSLGGSWARGADLSAALTKISAQKKPIHCHFAETDNQGYALLARHCDRISMEPGGVLNLIGVSAETVYAKDLLDTLGMSAELMQVGRFKGAADSLTTNQMPEETRQTLNAILDRLQSVVLGALEARAARDADPARKLRGVALQALIDGGPFTAGRARAAGLVDTLGYDDAARAEAKAAAKVDAVEVSSQFDEPEPMGIGQLIGALTGGREDETSKDKRLVLAYLTGTIMDGDPSSVRGADAEPFVAAMRRFADDENVRAVVLRIDSPGGSAPASDRMWHALARLSKRKPVIVSVGDMAASGGYYIASAGTEILARDDSLVGSIGVVGGKIVAADLAQRSGVHFERLQRGQNSGWPSAVHRFSDSERAAIRELLESTYRLFLERVALGRKLPQARIEAVAEGRLLMGGTAREAGLVDAEGGLSEALARARKLGGLGAEAPLEVWPQERSLVEQLVHGVSSGPVGGASLAQRLLLRAVDLPPSAVLEVLLAGRQQAAAALPFTLQIR
jgi:protease-4